VSSPITIHKHSVTIMLSRDDSYSLNGEACSAVLYKGRYRYRMSEAGESVIVGKGMERKKCCSAASRAEYLKKRIANFGTGGLAGKPGHG
jgi:hypothetical protein